MPKPTLEEIKLKADEYAKVAKSLERAQLAREAEMSPIIERHANELQPVLDAHAPKIEKLEAKAQALRSEVVAWLGSKSKTYAAESEKATFGVTVGSKELERQPDKKKLWDLCKKKGVEFFDLVNVMLAEADKRLGKKEIDAISERRTVARRDEYLKLK